MSDTVFLDTLNQLIEVGIVLTQTKQRPKSRIFADWQSTETLYSVVHAEQFKQWRSAVLTALRAHYGEDSDAYWAFQETCRFPQFMELLEGIKLLKHIQQLQQTEQPSCLEHGK